MSKVGSSVIGGNHTNRPSNSHLKEIFFMTGNIVFRRCIFQTGNVYVHTYIRTIADCMWGEDCGQLGENEWYRDEFASANCVHPGGHLGRNHGMGEGAF